MAELLLEILSEEIPARMQARAADDLKRLITDRLEKDGLKFESLQTFVTPRRLTLVVDGLPVETEAVEEDRRGPSKAAPEKAVVGFAKSIGVSVDQLEIRDTGKGEYYFAVVKEDARQTIDYMPIIVSEAVFNMGWPKSMRWHSTAMTWVRPIQSILAIFNGKPLDDIFQLGLKDKIPGLKFAMNGGSDAAPGELEIPISDRTTGHRFLSPKPFKVNNFADYKAKLEKAHVILDPAERRARIEAEAGKLAKAAKLTLKDDPGLLVEVAGLVEWPVALMGSIDKAFMDLPDEVLTMSMRHHQKYFALTDAKGKLAPKFIVIANTEASDKGESIVSGNERVLKARLSDAKFFWDQDRRETLESRAGALKDRVFHAKLGSVHDKVRRVEKLAGAVAEYCGADADDAKRAARLAKADLSTGMVAEFPELQGVIGRYYALADGEPPEVADAIAEHYSPQGPNDACPSAPVSIAVALADKIDTLAGFWTIDEKPTGSKDPFALRRAALGVIRLIVENGLRLPLRSVFETHYGLIDSAIHRVEIRRVVDRKPEEGDIQVFAPPEQPEEIERRKTNVSSDLLDFLAERLKVQMRAHGVRHDLIAASFAVEKPGGGLEDDLVRLLARVEALTAVLESDDGADLLTAYKRASIIVRIE
ncbi:MAG: glycine--tRNA ligase subunit beta, partial [Alphaproteobacteria bacterium]|nr:glycine--tRNA ligase subunit beta [Alphaproteobacteria bacterium]